MLNSLYCFIFINNNILYFARKITYTYNTLGLPCPFRITCKLGRQNIQHCAQVERNYLIFRSHVNIVSLIIKLQIINYTKINTVYVQRKVYKGELIPQEISSSDGSVFSWKINMTYYAAYLWRQILTSRRRPSFNRAFQFISDIGLSQF